MKHTFCKLCLAWILKAEAYKHWGKYFCERCMNDILDEETNRREDEKRTAGKMRKVPESRIKLLQIKIFNGILHTL
jgi:superfamily II helicase